MVEFFSKLECRGIKISRVNSIRVAKPLIFNNILGAVNPQVTSSWAVVFLELRVSIPYLGIPLQGKGFSSSTWAH